MLKSTLALALLSLASQVQAAEYGILDMASFKLSVVKQADTLEGNFYIRNKKNGKYLQFYRDTNADLTNVHALTSKGPIELLHSSAYGKSGVNLGTYGGTILRGENSKCLAAQWGEEKGYGLDVAGVAYACTVGDQDVGTSTLEVAKQFWRFVECGEQDTSDDATVAVNFAAQSSTSDSASTAEFKAANAKKVAAAKKEEAAAAVKEESTPVASTDKAFDKNDRSTWNCKKDGEWLNAHPDYITHATPKHPECADELAAYRAGNSDWKDVRGNGGIDPYDQSTWVCQHDGKWLNRHPDYIIKGGHIECKDTLAAYRAKLGRRALHRRRFSPKSESSLVKRASSKTYCIIAEDHLSDMATRALGPNPVASFGGHTSQELVFYDPTDLGQQWEVVKA